MRTGAGAATVAVVTSLVRAVEHGGLTLLTVQTPDLTLGFLPQRGGRLVSVRSEGREFLWHDPLVLTDALHPVPGAQPLPDAADGDGEGSGSGDAAPGGGEFSVEVVEEPGVVEIVLTGAADAASGLMVTRTFRIPARGGSFLQTSQLTNASDRPVRWSVSELVQVDRSPGGDADDREDRQDATVLRHADGAVEFTHGGRTLRITGAPLTVGGGPDPDPGRDHVELELAGHPTTLAPGRSTALHLRWSV